MRRSINLKCIVIALFVLGSLNLSAQQLNVGAVLQKNHGLYWENGIALQYYFAGFKPNQFYIGFDFISSRLGSAFRSNALKQDSYMVSAGWYFRKDKPLRFFAEFNVGYFHVDLEEEIFDELPNTDFLLSPELGLSYAFDQLPITIDLATGLNTGLKESGKSPGTIQFLYYNLSVYYRLNKITKDEIIIE